MVEAKDKWEKKVIKERLNLEMVSEIRQGNMHLINLVPDKENIMSVTCNELTEHESRPCERDKTVSPKSKFRDLPLKELHIKTKLGRFGRSSSAYDARTPLSRRGKVSSPKTATLESPSRR